VGWRYCYKGSGPTGKGCVALSGDLNEMGAPKNQLGINQGSKSGNKEEGGCIARNGEALSSAFDEYYTKNSIWQDWGLKTGFSSKQAKSKDRLE
jgi:hypothetical protein